MRRIVYKIVKYIFRAIYLLKLYWPLVYAYSKLFEKVEPGNGIKTDTSKPGILGIKSQYFMNDLEILANTGEFNVYKIKNKWQDILLRVYWKDDAWKDGEESYFQIVDPEVIEYQKKLRKFLKDVLSCLYGIMKIDAVICANVTYKDCYDWGIATKETGVPYIVLQRENLFACSGLVRLWYIKVGRLGKFHGSKVVLHNSMVKDIYLKSGYATEDQIAVLGCLRMDNYIKKIKAATPLKGRKFKRAALFSFHHITLLETIYDEYFNPEIGYVKFFEDTHVTFARTAIANPDVEFVIKPRYSIVYYEQIEKALCRNNLKLKEIPNLKLNADINPHDLILNSDVVCGFGSTVILEAAIAEKPVIIPYFHEALKEEYQEFILFKEYFNLFNVARSPGDLQALIEKNLENPQVSKEYIEKMTGLFEQYVSSFDANATERYTKFIKSVIEESKK